MRAISVKIGKFEVQFEKGRFNLIKRTRSYVFVSPLNPSNVKLNDSTFTKLKVPRKLQCEVLTFIRSVK